MALSGVSRALCNTVHLPCPYAEDNAIINVLHSETQISKPSKRGSHLHITCRNICDRDQNGIKQLFFLGADEDIKTNSEQLISTDQCACFLRHTCILQEASCTATFLSFEPV